MSLPTRRPRRGSHPTRSAAFALTALGGLGVVLAGCDWVDATGRQSGSGAPTIQLGAAAPGEATQIDENSVSRLVASGASVDDRYEWATTSLAEGVLDTCATLDDFRQDIAASSLAEACTDADDCDFAFVREQSDADDPPGDEAPAAAVAFSLRVPPLKAPVGVRRVLTVTTAAGESVSSDHDFCLISINEAPEARDDGPFTLREGQTLTIDGDGAQSLLANDSDDVDVANQPLSIDPVPARAPSSSSDFRLGTDGGFSYTAGDRGILGAINDSFEYTVSDGSLSAVATVTLRITAANGAPFLADPVMPLEAIAGMPFEVDLGARFADPDEDMLSFSAAGDELPPSGALALSREGVLSGTPLDSDVGSYLLTIVASDGRRETSVIVPLTVLPAANAAPEYIEGSTRDLALLLNERVALSSAEFIDPDGDTLVYALEGELPRGLSFDTDTAEISGRVRERGTFASLSVVATDPDGASASSETFMIRVF